MKRIGRWSSAVTTVLVAGGLLLGASRLEAAAPKNGDGDAQTAKCAYLPRIITYPYVNPLIKSLATSLYNSIGCQPAV